MLSVLCTLLIYGFCAGSAVRDVFSSSLCFPLTTEDPAEKAEIEKSAECCRKILNHVNEEVKVMENLLVRNTQFTTWSNSHIVTEHQMISVC